MGEVSPEKEEEEVGGGGCRFLVLRCGVFSYFLVSHVALMR